MERNDFPLAATRRERPLLCYFLLGLRARYGNMKGLTDESKLLRLKACRIQYQNSDNSSRVSVYAGEKSCHDVICGSKPVMELAPVYKHKCASDSPF